MSSRTFKVAVVAASVGVSFQGCGGSDEDKKPKAAENNVVEKTIDQAVDKFEDKAEQVLDTVAEKIEEVVPSAQKKVVEEVKKSVKKSMEEAVEQVAEDLQETVKAATTSAADEKTDEDQEEHSSANDDKDVTESSKMSRMERIWNHPATKTGGVVAAIGISACAAVTAFGPKFQNENLSCEQGAFLVGDKCHKCDATSEQDGQVCKNTHKKQCTTVKSGQWVKKTCYTQVPCTGFEFDADQEKCVCPHGQQPNTKGDGCDVAPGQNTQVEKSLEIDIIAEEDKTAQKTCPDTHKDEEGDKCFKNYENGEDASFSKTGLNKKVAESCPDQEVDGKCITTDALNTLTAHGTLAGKTVTCGNGYYAKAGNCEQRTKQSLLPEANLDADLDTLKSYFKDPARAEVIKTKMSKSNATTADIEAHVNKQDRETLKSWLCTGELVGQQCYAKLGDDKLQFVLDMTNTAFSDKSKKCTGKQVPVDDLCASDQQEKDKWEALKPKLNVDKFSEAAYDAGFKCNIEFKKNGEACEPRAQVPKDFTCEKKLESGRCAKVVEHAAWHDTEKLWRCPGNHVAANKSCSILTGATRSADEDKQKNKVGKATFKCPLGQIFNQENTACVMPTRKALNKAPETITDFAKVETKTPAQNDIAPNKVIEPDTSFSKYFNPKTYFQGFNWWTKKMTGSLKKDTDLDALVGSYPGTAKNDMKTSVIRFIVADTIYTE